MIPRIILYKIAAKVFGKGASYMLNEQFENLIRCIEKEEYK